MACKKSYDKDNASFSYGNGFKNGWCEYLLTDWTLHQDIA